MIATTQTYCFLFRGWSLPFGSIALLATIQAIEPSAELCKANFRVVIVSEIHPGNSTPIGIRRSNSPRMGIV